MQTDSDGLPRREISKKCIVSDLKHIGVLDGDHVAVTLSFKSIGHVKGGSDTFVDALLDTVGPKGTIMMNTYTRFFPLSRVESTHIFDQSSTPSITGLVPETLRKRKDSVRSRHPATSVTAVGKFAEYLTRDHDESSRLYLPYSKLAEVGGKYLCIGLGNNLVAIRHEAQYRAGLFDVVHRFHALKYRDREGKVKVFVFNHPPCKRRLPELVPHLIRTRIVRRGRVGMAYSLLGLAGNIISSIASTLEENPTLNLCDKIYCLWCREAERKLDIYEKIKSPKYFQKSPPLMKFTAFINNFRLKKYKSLSFQ